MSLPRPWGCPKCRHRESFVIDTASDEEGYVVRMRRCTLCKTTWATEERPLAYSTSFWARAHSRKQAWIRNHRKRTRPCAKCGEQYHWGGFSQHVALSKKHEASLDVVDRDRLRARRYARQWARKRRRVA